MVDSEDLFLVAYRERRVLWIPDPGDELHKRRRIGRGGFGGSAAGAYGGDADPAACTTIFETQQAFWGNSAEGMAVSAKKDLRECMAFERLVILIV